MILRFIDNLYAVVAALIRRYRLGNLSFSRDTWLALQIYLRICNALVIIIRLGSSFGYQRGQACTLDVIASQKGSSFPWLSCF